MPDTVKSTPKPAPSGKSQLLKLALELGPLVLFFVSNARGKGWIAKYEFLSGFDPEQPIFLATAIFMVAMIISLVASWALLRRIAVMPMVTLVVVLVFGGLTLYLKDDTFIKLKPTIINLMFGGALLGGLLFKTSLLRYVFGEAFAVNDEGWKILTFRWGVFFIFLAIANEIVWRNFDTDFWVSFKVWGIMPITMIFSMLQMRVISSHSLEQADAEE